MKVKCIRINCSTLKKTEEQIDIRLEWNPSESLKDHWWLVVPNTFYSASVSSLKVHAPNQGGWHANVLTKTVKGIDDETGEPYFIPGYDDVFIPQTEIDKVLRLCEQLIWNYNNL